jgi:hypothetical protein
MENLKPENVEPDGIIFLPVTARERRARATPALPPAFWPSL